jgi:predicted nucleotidyltransferase
LINPTAYPDINHLLSELLTRQQQILGEKLIGLYLYGSLVWGDFDHDTSDIDMLAATASDVNDAELEQLRHMHNEFARQHPTWNDRIEVQYFSLAGLKTFKTQASNMVNISPGEPIHRIQAGKEWLMNWYFVQDYGVTLFGPPPATFIDPISKAEFIQAVHDHAQQWREYVKDLKEQPQGQSYAILTICRALYTSRNSEQVSKKQAALWATEQLPDWSTLIHNAMAGRKEPQNNKATYPETEAFVNFIIDQIVSQP